MQSKAKKKIKAYQSRNTPEIQVGASREIPISHPGARWEMLASPGGEMGIPRLAGGRSNDAQFPYGSTPTVCFHIPQVGWGSGGALVNMWSYTFGGVGFGRAVANF